MDWFFTLTDWLDRFTIWLAAGAALFSGIGWWKGRKQRQQIDIVLQFQQQRFTLPLQVLRLHCTRAEVFGILGAFCKGSKFEIPYTGTPAFFNQLNAVQRGDENELIIEIEEASEFAKFAKQADSKA